jgi:hypothetical protein
MRKKLGEELLERGLITPKQLSEALELQRRRGLRLGAALVQCGHLGETHLVKVLSDLLHIRVVDLSRMEPDAHAIALVKHSFAAEHSLFPYEQRWERGRTHLTVAMADPLNVRVIDELGFITNANIEPVLARPSDIDEAIRKHYGPKVPTGYAPVRLDSKAGSPNMTILRPGGDEELVNTSTGDMPKPSFANVPVILPEEVSHSAKDEISAIVLTEEVTDDEQPRGAIPVAPPTSAHAALEQPIPLTEVKARPFVGREPDTNPYFNEALGALIDRAGEAVNAESFVRLERKFWALMRVLAKKGILTNEDFLRELGEEEELH